MNKYRLGSQNHNQSRITDSSCCRHRHQWSSAWDIRCCCWHYLSCHITKINPHLSLLFCITHSQFKVPDRSTGTHNCKGRWVIEYRVLASIVGNWPDLKWRRILRQRKEKRSTTLQHWEVFQINKRTSMQHWRKYLEQQVTPQK